VHHWKQRLAAGLVFSTSHAAASVLWSPQTVETTARLTQAEYLPGTGYSIAIEAPPGAYVLEFSEDLGPPPWQNLATLHPANGEAAYLDATAVSRERGFYRVGGGFSLPATIRSLPDSRWSLDSAARRTAGHAAICSVD
jgi:hypothetical protein